MCAFLTLTAVSTIGCDCGPGFDYFCEIDCSDPTLIVTFQPEMQAQCTLINFTVTRDGLEEQLLAEVVRCERPDLEELKVRKFKL